ncbi:metal/formaldehyde-sensitive transcriptional repressor [Acidovorax kalamii]|uniref:Regulator n=1 Tax=Acidovorax kalamii TaxID=2004485 RepID=A0A235EQF5_9BURK|nr:metal/formaldehyde-sensitive transcriptional repressor [Acidovorax kalamii]OYD51252.1 regulator [Acidovorax kalamii]
MPHTPEDKQRAITRLRRIKGQAEALERAVEAAGSDCAPILQQLAAMRGAVHGLMADLLDSHVRETLAEKPAPSQAAIDETLALLRSYLK